MKSSKSVLITGASSGLGTAFAHVFARHGYNLILTGRSEKMLQTVKKAIQSHFPVEISYLPLELTQENACIKLLSWIEKQELPVDILVNNAGIGNYGKFTNIPLEKERELIELNMGVVTELCHRLIPSLIKRKGKILNVASLAAFQPGTYYATYYASKAYVLLFTEALALEYKNDGITISALCPGPSPTNFFEKAGMPDTSKLFRMSMTDPYKVAEYGYKGLMANKTVILPGLKYHIVPFGSRILPRRIIAMINKKMVEIVAKG